MVGRAAGQTILDGLNPDSEQVGVIGNSVRIELLPFFAPWIPVTDCRAVLSITRVLNVIVRSANDIKLISVIVNIFLAIDDFEISDSVECSLRSLTELPVGGLIV
jgi:hypothetical protein